MSFSSCSVPNCSQSDQINDDNNNVSENQNFLYSQTINTTTTNGKIPLSVEDKHIISQDNNIKNQMSSNDFKETKFTRNNDDLLNSLLRSVTSSVLELFKKFLIYFKIFFDHNLQYPSIIDTKICLFTQIPFFENISSR